jgi:thymidylate synthase (FAD)
LPPDVQARAVAIIRDTRDKTWEAYAELVSMGVANELARLVLQLSQYTRLQLKGSALSWLKFLDLHLRTDVQWETRQFAKAIAEAFRAVWPKTWEVFEEHTLYAQTFSRSEVESLIKAVQDPLFVDAVARTPTSNPDVAKVLEKLFTKRIDLLE